MRLAQRRPRFELTVTQQSSGRQLPPRWFHSMTEAKAFAQRFITPTADKRGRPIPRTFRIEVKDIRSGSIHEPFIDE